MKKMIIKPDSFSGQGDIKTFILQYEKAAQINSYDRSRNRSKDRGNNSNTKQ